LGYDLDEERHLIINEHEAEAIRSIFEMYDNGYGTMAIIDYLNEQGYVPKRGGTFGKNSLFSILENEKYTGVFIFNRHNTKTSEGKSTSRKFKTPDQIIRIENGCPAIISKELFQRVQKRKQANKRNTGQYHSNEFYLMTGKIFCGSCGKRLQGNVRYSGKSKKKLATYRCETLRKFCKNKGCKQSYLDAYVVQILEQEIFTSQKLRRRINAVNAYVEQYNAKYEEISEKISS